jgi:hypothetical protein
MRLSLNSLFWAAVLPLLAATVALAQSGGSATIYKWVDEKGVTHYSESPPRRGSPQQIELPRSPAPTNAQPVMPEKSWEQQDAEFRKRQIERERSEKTEAAKGQAVRTAEAMQKQRCADAKSRIAQLQLQRRGPAPTVNEKGEIELWNYEQRGRELNALGKFVDENCRSD